MTKWSRLEVKKNFSLAFKWFFQDGGQIKFGRHFVFSDRKLDLKSVLEMAIRMPDRPAFGCILYSELNVHVFGSPLYSQRPGHEN
jgi:hypothetical protein